jgi:iron complex transport system ATP-binding protein
VRNAAELESVSVEYDGVAVVDEVSWTVKQDERWVVLGPNGSGKTTLLKILSARLHPTRGIARVLGSKLGGVDVRELRKHIGVVSGSVIRSLRSDIVVSDVVLSGTRAALETWWDEFSNEERRAATEAMVRNDVLQLRDRPFDVISEGERQRVLLARAMVTSPGLLVLDEPFAGLDLGARERLLLRLREVFADSSAPPVVLVTHHAEEIPPETTHVLLLRNGRVVAAGATGDVLTSQHVSKAFDLDVSVFRSENGRWSSQVQ